MAESAYLAIIGGGAAGLAAAIFAAERAGANRRIVILDSAKTLGAKILVSGGGRCNVTHEVVRPEDFNGSPRIVRNILAGFTVEETIRWFASLGVELKREPTGKLFPVTDSARSVLHALLDRCRQLGVVIQTGCKAGRVLPPTASLPRFTVEHAGGSLQCTKVILATGGRSLPRSGSDGSGWAIAAQLGHTVTPTYPALVPLLLDARMFHLELAGVSLPVELSIFAGSRLVDRRCGSLLWTHFGLSGPVVMDASRHWVIAQATGLQPEMYCHLLPPDQFPALEQWLVHLARSRPRAALIRGLADRLPERLAAALAHHVGIEPAITCAHLSREQRRALVHALSALALPVVGHRGWNYAEVTAGGVPLSEIDYRTLESRKVAGLFLVGEILDCDGRIGGFNFQWAWSTARLAGSAVVNPNAGGCMMNAE